MPNDWRWIGGEYSATETLDNGLPDLFGELPLPWEEPLAAGVDEAGRGALAGPVCVAAVILDPSTPIEGLNDSKKLTVAERERLAIEIREKATAWAVAWGSVEEIDEHNILQATMIALKRAVNDLSVKPTTVMIDGNYRPKGLPYPACTLVKGDARVAQIAAASILAKTSRDHLMTEMEGNYPGYHFAKHAGYGTAVHLEALKVLGPSAIHRKTFDPVKTMLANGTTPRDTASLETKE